MNVDEYVAARYGRLLERAVELGAEEGLAAEYVDQVLLEQRKAIKRAEDPDPLVHEALERAVLKKPKPGISPWPFVGVGLVTIAVIVGVVLTREPETDPMPSLFGFTGAAGPAAARGRGVRRGAAPGPRVRAGGPGDGVRPEGR